MAPVMMFTPRRRWVIGAATLGAAVVVAWAVFHPPFRPDPGVVDPRVREALARVGFEATRGIRSVRMETVEDAVAWTIEQSIVAVDPLMTEKRSERRTHGGFGQASGLYVGPFTVVRFARPWPPLVGDLLPYHFWSSLQMTDFAIDEVRGFPATPGGKLLARVSYSERFADGELAREQRYRLDCDVAKVIEAKEIDARLTGTAARIDCSELLESGSGARRIGLQRPSMGRVRYSYWYVVDKRWSLAIEGGWTVRLGDEEADIAWRSRLLSFEAGKE